MKTFLDIALSFPTVVFSLLLAVAVAWWLLTLIGLLDADILDLSGSGGEGDLGGFSGFLLKFGLDGFPIALVVTGIALLAWTMSYFLDHYLLRELGSGLRLALGAVALLALLFVALPLTGLALYPLKPLFANLAGPEPSSLLMREAIVRSPELGAALGEVNLDDGGAGLILKACSDAGTFMRGERVVLIEYLPERNAYRVARA